ncbi:MAG: ribosome recycling factor [Zetaproteobacteria bacterium]|nr:ribosome recycling factor [Zetaproteobacteria bacterium]
MNSFVLDCERDMAKRINGLERELTRVRTGRATVTMLDGVKVEYYGSATPLNQVAAIATPDARTIVISPYEKSLIADIEKAIHIADLGIQPMNDGNVVRLAVPPLTEERRKSSAQSIKKIGEDAKIAIRKVRQDINNKVKQQEKAKEIAEDEAKRIQKDIQTETDKFVKQVDSILNHKEQEIMTV